MEKILIIGDNAASQLTASQLKNEYEVQVISETDYTDVSTYADIDPQINMIVSFIGPMDTDLAMQSLIDVIDEKKLPLKRILFVSAAGIDDEVVGQLKYPDVSDVHEFKQEQRYAIKLIDELEIPYTIFRPVMVADSGADAVQLINEGQPVPSGTITPQQLSQVVTDAIQHDKYVNQSIAIAPK